MKTTNLQIQEVPQIPQARNMKKITPRDIKIKLLKTSDRKNTLQAAREKKKDPICTEEQRWGWQPISHGKQHKQADSG